MAFGAFGALQERIYTYTLSTGSVRISLRIYFLSDYK